MGIEVLIGAIGVAASVAGTVMGVDAAQKQASASEKIANLQEQQAELDTARHKRQVYRDMLKAQAASETAGASQGAMFSSSVEGGINEAAGNAMVSQRDANQNMDISRQQFAAQRDIASAGAQSVMAQGVSSLGGAITKNLGDIARVGNLAMSSIDKYKNGKFATT